MKDQEFPKDRIRMTNEEFIEYMDNLPRDFEDLIDEKIGELISIISEKNYRRGYSHGFSAGATHGRTKNFDDISLLNYQILLWRNDPTNQDGAPGSCGENQQFKYKKN